MLSPREIEVVHHDNVVIEELTVQTSYLAQKQKSNPSLWTIGGYTLWVAAALVFARLIAGLDLWYGTGAILLTVVLAIVGTGFFLIDLVKPRSSNALIVKTVSAICILAISLFFAYQCCAEIVMLLAQALLSMGHS